MQEMLDKKKAEPALWVCVVMLFLAIPSGWPYGYYTLLRWVVCLTTGYFAYEDYRHGRRKSPILLGAIAILFNPIAPVHLNKADWALADFVVAIILIFYGLRGKALRLKFGKKTRRNLVMGIGLCVMSLGLWAAWSQHRDSTYDYPISLVSSQTNFRPEQRLKNIKGELVVHGWQVRPVTGRPHAYLVSYTYSQSTPLDLSHLPGQLGQNLFDDLIEPSGTSDASVIIQHKKDLPSTGGWWWEVNTDVPLVRPVLGDTALEAKYGVAPQLLAIIGEVIRTDEQDGGVGIKDDLGFITPIHLTESTQFLTRDGKPIAGARMYHLTQETLLGNRVEVIYRFNHEDKKRYALEVFELKLASSQNR